jgi:hypothetical protein
MIDLKQRRSCLEAKKSIMIYENDTSLSPLCMLYSKEDGEWGGARPLSPEDILSLVDTEARTPRVLPEYVLWHEEGKITMWWSPKKKDKITVRGEKKTYTHPAYLFLGYSNNYGPSLKVLPIENKRPTEKSAILESPYRGIDVHPKSKGMGACRVNMPNTLTLDNWWEFENAFRYSNFNYKPKPSRYLKPIGVTVKDWIDSLNLIPNGPQGL